MKVLAINGSHRKGNTQFMLETIIKEINIKDENNQTALINLREKNIGFCNEEDYSCKETENCSCCRDDMKDIYKLLEWSDMIIFGSPIYFGNVSGMMKTFMDRWNPYWLNKKLVNKKAIIIMVGGSQQKQIQQIVGRLSCFINVLGMKLVAKYFTRAQESDGVSKNKKVINELKQLIAKID